MTANENGTDIDILVNDEIFNKTLIEEGEFNYKLDAKLIIYCQTTCRHGGGDDTSIFLMGPCSNSA